MGFALSLASTALVWTNRSARTLRSSNVRITSGRLDLHEQLNPLPGLHIVHLRAAFFMEKHLRAIASIILAVLCATPMQWVERFGKQLALALLVFMWPVIDALQKSVLPAGYVAMFALTAGAYVVVYGSYCLWGHSNRNEAVPVGTAILLTFLGLALQHMAGAPDFNFFLIPLVVAGFELTPRPALMNIAFVATAATLDTVVLDNLPPARRALQLALVFPPLLSIPRSRDSWAV